METLLALIYKQSDGQFLFLMVLLSYIVTGQFLGLIFNVILNFTGLTLLTQFGAFQARLDSLVIYLHQPHWSRSRYVPELHLP